MQTRNNSIVAALVLLSLVSGAIGCKSNGGAWYKPNSYSLHNPFKKEERNPFKKEEPIAPYQATAKPSIGAQPNVTPPPGGYGNKAQEAEFTAGKMEKQVQPQYGQTITGGIQPETQVAMSDPNVYGGNAPVGYTYPTDSGAYSNPNQYSPVTPQNYQSTSIQQPGYPTGPNPADYAAPNTGVASPSAYPSTVPPTNYSPFVSPAGQPYDAAPPQGFAPPATYDPAPQQGFGAPQQGYGVPQQGYGVNPNGYTSPPNYGGYTALPSTAGGY